ncbi:MAG TPA: carbohydrate kinase family protein [Mariniphaga sp.]|nr:carbohydrate kinase family protein [Mariniphaga sp.]
MDKKIRVSMVGCCLVDRVYNNISFFDPSFLPFLSKRRGDGGLTPGKLVFKEEFEKFCEVNLPTIIDKITYKTLSAKVSIGGPGIVPLIHISQMLYGSENECHFYGCSGNDEDSEFIRSILKNMNISLENYSMSDKPTPSTIVLSDPDYDSGHGERIFINSIGAAWEYTPDKLDECFFSSDIVIFGGTALVPQIHDHLTELLETAKANGCITIVNTVYDFKNEKDNPHNKWPLGKNDSSYHNIDLLITDREEALRLSGKNNIENAIKFFRDKGTEAVIITNGPNNIKVFSGKQSVFIDSGLCELPVADIKSWKLAKKHGDTTGCGDNFAGGVIANLVIQLQNGDEKLDLLEACTWGVVSGGFTCFHVGGTYVENYPGEKRDLITFYYEKYKQNKIDSEN